MKKLMFVAVIAAALVVGTSASYADHGWSTAGKVLTGVLAADILLNHTGYHGGYYGGYYGGGYGYGYGGVGFSYGHYGRHSSYGFSYYGGPAYYSPPPVYYYRPAPVYHYGPPRVYRYYRSYPSYRW